MLNPWVLAGALAGAIALAGGSFMAGIKVESNSRDAQLRIQERAFSAQYRRDFATQRDRLAASATRLSEAEAARAKESTRFREEIRRAKQLFICPAPAVVVVNPDPGGMAPGADREPGGHLSDEFVRLYNRALYGIRGSPDADRGATDGGAAGSDPAAGGGGNLPGGAAR